MHICMYTHTLTHTHTYTCIATAATETASLSGEVEEDSIPPERRKGTEKQLALPDGGTRREVLAARRRERRLEDSWQRLESEYAPATARQRAVIALQEGFEEGAAVMQEFGKGTQTVLKEGALRLRKVMTAWALRQVREREERGREERERGGEGGGGGGGGWGGGGGRGGALRQ
jgi:hypothetical protein